LLGFGGGAVVQLVVWAYENPADTLSSTKAVVAITVVFRRCITFLSYVELRVPPLRILGTRKTEEVRAAG